MRRFPLILQRDAIQCGVSCLQMICKYYGQSYSFEELEKICFPTVEGISLLGIKDAAETVGLSTTCCQLSLHALKKISFPCILHWNQNHFVVLYKYKRGKFYIADPGIGKTEYLEKEFVKYWSFDHQNSNMGTCLLLVPTESFLNNSKQDKAKSSSLKVVIGYIQQYKKYLAIIAMGLLVGCVLEIILPFFDTIYC